MYSYDTSSEALADLRRRGYTYDFNLGARCLECGALKREWEADQFDVKEMYRFEGASNPDDSEVVYAIESSDGVRGVLLKAFGIYAEPIPESLRGKLHR